MVKMFLKLEQTSAAALCDIVGGALLLKENFKNKNQKRKKRKKFKKKRENFPVAELSYIAALQLCYIPAPSPVDNDDYCDDNY